jgi:hypothetical protein
VKLLDRVAQSNGQTARCGYCGGAAEYVSRVMPASQGGGRIANEVPACIPCGAAKGAMTVRQWIAYEVAESRLWRQVLRRLGYTPKVHTGRPQPAPSLVGGSADRASRQMSEASP